MRITRLGILAAITMALTTSPAHAAPHQFKFLAGSGVGGWGTQVGTYKGQLDGNAIDIWCVDFANHISPGSQFQVNLTGLGGSPSLANTRFGFYTNALARYRQAAWLAWQFTTTSQSSWKYIHAAIWHLMTPAQPSITAASDIALVNGWLTNASTNYARYNYSNAFVITDVALARCHATSPTGGALNGCGYQEQLTFTGPLTVTTPEPASMVLLATGLIALTVTSRRRRKSLLR